MKLSHRAAICAGISVNLAPPRFETELDDYFGVILRDGDYRLSISPKGNAYLPQEREGDFWFCLRPLECSDLLTFWLSEIHGEFPEGILALAETLPYEPRDYFREHFKGRV